MILPILQYGDPILRAKGERIEKIDEGIRQLAVNMIETMHEAHGVGLAAQQVGRPLQLTVLDVSAVEDRPSTLKLSGKDVDPKSAMPIVLINPEIEVRGETEVGVEGCLSFPEITADIERAQSVLVRAQTLEGEMFQIEASGLLARAIQHEHDHLQGILVHRSDELRGKSRVVESPETIAKGNETRRPASRRICKRNGVVTV